MVNPPFLQLENIGKRFGGTVALADFDWSVDEGEVHCLIGENGSGKSTLIKIVAGVHAPEPGGRILVNGSAYARLTPAESKKLGIQVIYQDLSLFPNLSVLENIAIDRELGALAAVVHKREMRGIAEDALARLDTKLSLTTLVKDLSVAERQIVAICRGIAANAKLLFMDEPTSSLTHREVDLLLGVIRRLETLGVAIVFVSHRLEEVVHIAKRVTILRDGRKVATLPARDIDRHRLAELMTGSRFEQAVTARPVAGRKPVLEARSLTRPGEFTDVSFTLHAGEVVGLTGLLGAGRTELALTLFGMKRAESGEILVDDEPLRARSNDDTIKAGIAYVSEDRLSIGLNLRQSVADNIAVTVLDKLAGRSGFITLAKTQALASTWVERLGIRVAGVEAAVQTLSGGNQQRVVIAKWLATSPKILLLDSPTVGVDIRNKHAIYEVIRSLAADGVAILLISDEIPEVYYNSDRVLHMRAGRLMAEYIPGQVGEAELSEAVFA